ncbi:MAG TPA: alpha/beta fold hydrolase [Pseudonocardiaceae bacterium]|nr:alpha/beta fold hydrolase [Pseudonocardiaceae bacterium]
MRNLATAALAVLTGVTLVLTTQTGAAAAAPHSGFNDMSCRPSAAHPDPVVLLHGLGGNGPGNFAFLGPFLANAGYCAFAPTYGEEVPPIPVGGLVHIARSANEIAAFIDQVRANTGAAKVDVVGHSEGGFQSLYVPKVLGYADRIDRVVALAPPTHGTTFANLVGVADLLGIRPAVDTILNTFGCAACDELITGGSSVTTLDAGPIAQPGVAYTVIASTGDELVTPHETSFVSEPGVRNEFVQDSCPSDPVGHIGLAFDGDVAQLVANALDPAHATTITCSVGPPF